VAMDAKKKAQVEEEEKGSEVSLAYEAKYGNPKHKKKQSSPISLPAFDSPFAAAAQAAQAIAADGQSKGNPRAMSPTARAALLDRLQLQATTALGDDLEKFFAKEQFSDVRLIAGGKPLLCHAVILTSRCDHFRALLTGGFAERLEKGKRRDVALHGVPLSALRDLVRYLYSGQVMLSSLDLISRVELMVCADMFGLARLKDLCQSALCSELNAQNAALTLATSHKFQCEQLREVCLHFCVTNFAAVKASRGFQRLPRELRLEIGKGVQSHAAQPPTGGVFGIRDVFKCACDND